MRKNSVNIQKYSFLKILSSSDISVRKLPIMEIRGQNEVPVIWLNLCSYGEEIGGIYDWNR